MNLKKRDRLQGDYNELYGSQRALRDRYQDAKHEYRGVDAGLRRVIQGSRHKLPGFTEGDDLAVLLKCVPEDLRANGVELREVKRALQLRDEMADLEARSKALDIQIWPLSELLGRLNKFIEVHNRG